MKNEKIQKIKLITARVIFNENNLAKLINDTCQQCELNS